MSSDFVSESTSGKVLDANEAKSRRSSSSRRRNQQKPRLEYKPVKRSRPRKERRRSSGNKHDGPDLESSIQDELTSGNFRARGRKTQISINHLLDFQLPDRKALSADSGSNGQMRRKSKRLEREVVHLHGESFINANFRFLVDDRFEYSEQSLDPNFPIPREKIVRVVAPRGQACPICLSENMVAPCMVACGHLFCLTCLLHFFAITDQESNGYSKRNRHKECPLCSTFVSKERAIPVIFTNAEPQLVFAEVGHVETLQLMCKPHNSMLPLPANLGIDPKSLGNFPSAEMVELAPYCRIMKCGAELALKYYQMDLQNVESQFEQDKSLYDDDGTYAEMARDHIMKSMHQYQVQDVSNVTDRLSNLSLGVGLESYNDSNAFFFYETGFNALTTFYLSPLDVKILLSTFEHYSNFPTSLTAKVENVHYGFVVTEALIQRYKYFGHLPLGSELAFVDLDWRSVDFVPPEVHKRFAAELSQRRRKFNWKQQREDKEKRLYEKKLEKEHAEFFMKENGEVDSPPLCSLSSNPSVPLFSLSDKSTLEPKAQKTGSRMEKTVWGTSIPASQHSDTERTPEDAALEDMLLQMSKDGTQTKKKKKKVVTLLSSGQGRGAF
ncbi:LAMI_0H01684g1_1 [Lachancea mirantina]|uniref:LAMI_0H01684g1_1 n=1 Tax=Lachancea mirantina TaxID=1230905 RepID=A0A1G4KDS5_9SACH|nr:LAMI_0H01684g1_1 [Lachancea mirantina]